MLKCPFCSFDNEDGALFCEQCKSDLGSPVDTSAGTAPVAVPSALTTPVMAETIPLAPVATDASPPFDAASIPMAAPVALASEAPPAEAAPVQSPGLTSTAEDMPALADQPPAATSTQPKLVVVRGQKVGIEFPIYPGENFIGRTDEKPVDIDLEDQEPQERVWSSRQHACIICDESGAMTLEDLNSSNGTFVNRTRVFPGERRALKDNDTIQIGTVHMKVKI